MVRPAAISSPKLDPSASDALAEVCPRWGVIWLAVFGSRVEGTARPDSDLDVLIRLDPGTNPSLLDLVRLTDSLSQVFGVVVDLGEADALHPRIREQVLNRSRVLYAR